MNAWRQGAECVSQGWSVDLPTTLTLADTPQGWVWRGLGKADKGARRSTPAGAESWEPRGKNVLGGMISCVRGFRKVWQWRSESCPLGVAIRTLLVVWTREGHTDDARGEGKVAQGAAGEEDAGRRRERLGTSMSGLALEHARAQAQRGPLVSFYCFSR